MTVESRTDRESAKRRLMFVAGEDVYFLAYTAIILLAELGCTSESTPLIDSGKIAYLADLVGSDSDLNLALTSSPLGHSARSRLSLLNDRAVARRVPLERLVQALARQELITTSRNSGEPDRLYLSRSAGVDALCRNPLYNGERERINRLRRSFPQLRRMRLSTLKSRLFRARGIFTWGE